MYAHSATTRNVQYDEDHIKHNMFINSHIY